MKIAKIGLTKKFYFILLFVVQIICNNFLFGQNIENDSLCCSCFKFDTLEIKKVIQFKHHIKEIEPTYTQHLISLSENVDIIQFEKFQYLLKLDKFLKFELSKKIFTLENTNDSVLKKTKLELMYLNEILRVKIDSLDSKTSKCFEKEEIKKYLNKKNLIIGLEPSYFTNSVNLINSTIDTNKRNYTSVIALENKLLNKLELRKKKLDALERLTPIEAKELLLINDLIAETNNKIEKLEHEKGLVKSVIRDYSVDKEIEVPKIFYLRELVKNSDTIQFKSSKINEEKVIVVNNTMYHFRNDTLVEVLKHEDENQFESIFDNVKPLSIDDFDALFFTIQIGTYSKEVTMKELKVRSNLFFKILPNGNIRYSYGMFNNLQEVEKAKTLLESIGITDVVVIAYYNKEKISIKQAKKIKAGL